ncbi:hypothetical protein CMA01_12380 [Carnobacterium maltaromaticum]|nr:hypothetical protein CMA01_12380 [Carnobacterium maltaromaticum]
MITTSKKLIIIFNEIRPIFLINIVPSLFNLICLNEHLVQLSNYFPGNNFFSLGYIYSTRKGKIRFILSVNGRKMTMKCNYSLQKSVFSFH